MKTCSTFTFALLLFLSLESLVRGADEMEIKVTMSDQKQQIRSTSIHLKHDQTGDPALFRNFILTNPAGGDVAGSSVGSGFYRAAYAASLIKGQPFYNFNVVVSEAPDTALADSTAALAVGLIALWEHKDFPADTAVLGDLYPDGTLKPVGQIRERVDTLLSKGVKRIIVPALQVAVTQDDGTLLLLQDLANKSGATCIGAATLEEAVKAAQPELSFPIAIVSSDARDQAVALSAVFQPRVVKLIKACQVERAAAEAVKKYDDTLLPRAQLLDFARENLEAGLSAARAGRFYAAYEQLKIAQAQFQVARLQLGSSPSALLPKIEKDSKELVAQFADFESKNSPGGSLLKAYVFFQTSHAIHLLRGRLLGSENLVKKLQTGKKDAPEKDMRRAVASYAAAVEESRAQAETISDYELLSPDGGPTTLAKENEQVQFISRLAGRAFLDGGEHFFYRMQRFPSAQRPFLLYETGFYSQLSNLVEARDKDEAVSSLNGEVRLRKNDNLQQVSFVPGSSYVPPEQAPSSAGGKAETDHPLPMLMDYMNQISDQALLEFQMVDSDAKFDEAQQIWQFRHGTDLILVLQQAERRAEAALRTFRGLETTSPVPELIFQRGQLLAKMGQERMKLDALREFWRCTQLCLASRVISYTPAAVPVQPSTEPADPMATPAASVAPASEPAVEALPR